MIKDWNKSLRPKSFSDIKGLTKLVQNFQYLLEADNFPHVALFFGPSGVGKSCVAEICAKALVCTGASSGANLPCNQCLSCKSFNEGHSTNIHKYNMPDLKSKEEIDEVLNNIFRTAGIGRRVFILEEVQGMDQKTVQDRFLEDLTKVPDDVYIIMCTTQIHALSATFRNRTSEFYFPLPSDNECIELIRSIGVKNNLILPDDNLLRVFVRANRNVPRKIVGCLESFSSISSFSEKDINEFFDLQSREYYERLFCAMIDPSVKVYDFVKILKEDRTARIAKMFEGLRDFVVDVLMEISLGEYCGISKEMISKIQGLIDGRESVLYEVTECLSKIKDNDMENDNAAFFQLVNLKLRISNISIRTALTENAAQSSTQAMRSIRNLMRSKPGGAATPPEPKSGSTMTNKMVSSSADIQAILGDIPIVR